MGLQVTDTWKGINVNSTTIMLDVLVITYWTILANEPDILLHDKKREDLPTDQQSHNQIFKRSHKRNWKTKQVQRPGDQGQHDVESEDKNCASYNWSIRNRATEGHTNEHRMYHS